MRRKPAPQKLALDFHARLKLAERLLARRRIAEAPQREGLSACWEWQGALDPTGYGRVKFGGVKLYTHRAAVVAATGAELFSDDVVLHACDNPRCFNPDHLTVGDHALNLREAGARGLISRKLDAKQVAEIRAHLNAGKLAVATLAAIYGVSANMIVHIKERRYWADVEACA